MKQGNKTAGYCPSEVCRGFSQKLSRNCTKAFQFRTLFYVSLFLTTFSAVSSAGTINGTLTGTCGFYQGTRSNVVFSETFSQTSDGPGTFCSDFMAGGSFIQRLIFHVGDIFAFGSYDYVARAPAGYGVFVTFDGTLQVAQQYVVNSISSSTPTGTAQFVQVGYGGDSASYSFGSCEITASVDVAGAHPAPLGLSPSYPLIPVTFGQPFTAVETVHMACDRYSPQGWGDYGYYTAQYGDVLLYDDNGKLLGHGVVTAVPEPQNACLIAILGFPLLAISRFAVRRKG